MADPVLRDDGLAAALARARTQRVLQRAIGFDNLGGFGWTFYRVTNYQGQITRPAWVGRWAAPALPGLSRNHIIPYQLIGEALTNVSIQLFQHAAMGAAYGVPPAVAAMQPITALTAISDALYPNGGAGTVLTGPIPEYGVMVAQRTALVTAITGIANHAAPTGAEQVALANAASQLEASLASAPENVRAANANLNLRIGAGSDPVLQGGLGTVPAPAWVAGPIANVPAVPWAWAGGALGQTWSAAAPAAPLGAGATFYTLDPAANAIVYRFMSAATPYTGHDVTIIRNDDPHNLIPGYPLNAPLSSSLLPPGAANQPVLAFDPTGGSLPYRFG